MATMSESAHDSTPTDDGIWHLLTHSSIGVLVARAALHNVPLATRARGRMLVARAQGPAAWRGHPRDTRRCRGDCVTCRHARARLRLGCGPGAGGGRAAGRALDGREASMISGHQLCPAMREGRARLEREDAEERTRHLTPPL